MPLYEYKYPTIIWNPIKFRIKFKKKQRLAENYNLEFHNIKKTICKKNYYMLWKQDVFNNLEVIMRRDHNNQT